MALELPGEGVRIVEAERLCDERDGRLRLREELAKAIETYWSTVTPVEH